MYGKIFESMYDGSLYGHWQAIITFQQMITLCDKDGVFDMTPQALSGRTSIPLEIIEKGIEQLSQPDPRSRSHGEEGRRIVPLDPDRPWGWRIVNHAYYRDIANAEDKRMADRERLAGKRAMSQIVANGRDVSQKIAPTEAASDADTAKAAEAAAFDISECPKDMDPEKERKAFCLWCMENGKAPTSTRWLRWVRGAKESGRYAKAPRRPPPPIPDPPPVDPAFRAKSLRA